jgi:TRAP-type C4-dicarboxylate transport system permease small subunit
MTAKRRQEIKRQRRQNAIINTLTFLSVLFFIWVGISWFDYAANDMHNTEDASWNIFTIMVEARDTEERNVNTGAC